MPVPMRLHLLATIAVCSSATSAFHAAPALRLGVRGLAAAVNQNPADIYVLELEGGRVYVGKSHNVSRRVKQHMRGRGAAFTKYNPPTGRLLPRLGSLSGEGDGPERDETLRQMAALGVDRVRGWKHTGKTIDFRSCMEIESDMRELFDLCRRCGSPEHFAKECKATRDRHGLTID